jgi:hypothetical protein
MIQTGAGWIYPPMPLHEFQRLLFKIFLAGSIEMGAARDWQTEMSWDLKEYQDDILLLNPRRQDWDSSWEQKIDNPQFNEQVTWELDMLDAADVIVFYFDPNTKSPVTLLELGLHAPTRKHKFVYCPEGYWRKGNVDIVCKRYGIPVFNDKEEWLKAIKNEIDMWNNFMDY